jgi:hypothetical protein
MTASNAVRTTLALSTFDEGPCADWLKALKAYRKEMGRRPRLLEIPAPA